ncbi:hypothetical protein [Nocardia noduli]|uniref:hypothetical protein n=1 Tax=Nocardia noduli TaxID=2815722 RepID=UPI001C21A95C|nr:hypothetical protein [Nocardia noduli]
MRRFIERAPGIEGADRPVHHPNFSHDLIGNRRMRLGDSARVFVRFPPDSPKSRFLLEISWPQHTEDEVFDGWFRDLPIHQ